MFYFQIKRFKLNSNSNFNLQVSNLKPNSNSSTTCTKFVYLLLLYFLLSLSNFLEVVNDYYNFFSSFSLLCFYLKLRLDLSYGSFSQMKCITQRKHQHRMHISWFIIGHLTNLILLIEYAKRKENQINSKGSIIPKHPLINIFIYLTYYLSLILILGLYKSYPLNRNLALEICKKRDTTGLV
jgi:hypothetical protein